MMEESPADVFFLAFLMLSIPIYCGLRQELKRKLAERKNINL